VVSFVWLAPYAHVSDQVLPVRHDDLLRRDGRTRRMQHEGIVTLTGPGDTPAVGREWWHEAAT
jgi:hypothetical protein